MMSEHGRRRVKVEEIVPHAARTVASLRDVGYDTPRAIADLVDNSIAAGAKHVDVTLRFEGWHQWFEIPNDDELEVPAGDSDSSADAGDESRESWIRVADDGSGMDGATLQEGLRYGSDREYEADDLGKFGFGLKTASTSQCRRVTVAARRAPQNARLEVRCLDLDHIDSTSRWEILVLEGAERPRRVTEPLQNHPGTVVLWENLDRILEYKDPFGEWAKRKFLALAEEVDNHLGMVFHRFLAGEVPKRPLTITVNGSKVLPWDPFCRGEAKTEQLPAKDLTIAGGEGVGIVRVRPYVLPAQAEFSNDAEWRRASGPAKWNRQQGLYIYRANRMIQSGGWNRMRTTDEHNKLARVSVEFYPDLDSVFGINISKAYVNLPQELREKLEPVVSQVTRMADKRYRAKQSPRSGAAGGSGATRSTAAGDGYGSARASARGRDGDGRARAGARPRQAIEDAAVTVGEQGALGRIVQALRERHPEVARDLGW
jgi:hypothetical protein